MNDSVFLAATGCARRCFYTSIMQFWVVCCCHETGPILILFNSGLDKVSEIYGQLGFIDHDPSVKALLESGAEIDEQSLKIIKKFWSIPMCLKSITASLVGWFWNSPMLAAGIRTPLVARFWFSSWNFPLYVLLLWLRSFWLQKVYGKHNNNFILHKHDNYLQFDQFLRNFDCFQGIVEGHGVEGQKVGGRWGRDRWLEEPQHRRRYLTRICHASPQAWISRLASLCHHLHLSLQPLKFPGWISPGKTLIPNHSGVVH